VFEGSTLGDEDAAVLLQLQQHQGAGDAELAAGAEDAAQDAAAGAATADGLSLAVKQEQDDQQQQGEGLAATADGLQQQQDGPMARYVRVVPLNNEGEGGAALHSVAPGMAPNVPVNLVGKSHWHFGTHYKVGHIWFTMMFVWQMGAVVLTELLLHCPRVQRSVR
jgi:hypothetical protein